MSGPIPDWGAIAAIIAVGLFLWKLTQNVRKDVREVREDVQEWEVASAVFSFGP